MIYILNIILFLLVVFCVNILDLDITQKNKIILCLAFIQLFFIHAFRDPYNFNDTPIYADAYDFMCQYGFKNYLEQATFLKSEIGYVLLMWISSLISSNTQFIFIVTSIIILVGYFYSIKNYSSTIWLSILILLITNFNQSLFVIRQYIAISIVLCSFKYIITRNLWKYSLMLLLACLFHYSAIISIFLYFVYGFNFYERKKAILLIITSILLSILFKSAYIIAANWSLLGYTSYIEGEGTNAKMFILLFCVLILFIIGHRKDVVTNDIDKLIFCILLLGCVFSFAGIGFVATSRLNMYYSSIGLILALPSIIKSNNLIAKFGGIGIMLVLFYFYISNLPEIQVYKFAPLIQNIF